MKRSAIFLLIFAIAMMAGAQQPSALELRKGDHIAIVGSGLADRQQHHGWLEALIHKAHPDFDLTFRNLGFAADEVNVRPRSAGVPSTEAFLRLVKADVILAYWGFNESFRGPEGVEAFKRNMEAFVKQQAGADYGGSGKARLVLFSPIAHENLKDPNFPDGEANNRNLELYSRAIGEVARAANVPFVDLFTASKELYAKSASPLTFNGVHLTEAGDRQLAPAQFRGLFGKDGPGTDDPAVAKIREAVLEKNLEWHRRYRTVDQYNIYGDRSKISYAGVRNDTIMHQEMAQRDRKTENRDRRVWALAKGGDLRVVDDNLPPVAAVPPNSREKKAYLSGEEAIKHMAVPAGFKVELVASEETFPELVNPVQMNFDTKGRLWIAAWPTYPEATPTEKVFDKLLVFDLDPKTGKAAKCTTYLDGLNCPTGFQFYKDGVLVMQSPDLWWVRDTDGDGKTDWKERVLHGLDAADSHHETNSMCLEPGGAVYLSDGIFHRTNVETYNGPVRNTDGAIYRYEPLTGRFGRHVPYNFMNPHGRVFDYWGNDLITDGTGNENFFGPAFSGHLDAGQHPPMKQFWVRPSRPCAGTAILSSRHFPEEWQGNFLNCNVISIQGIMRAMLKDEGSGIKGETREHLVFGKVAGNPNFRPSGVAVAPDGAVYFMDWSQMLIGHLQHHLRDPYRDHQHGRIYRIICEGRPLLVPRKIAGASIGDLMEALKEPENDVRMRAKIELGMRDTRQVVAAVDKWVAGLDKTDKEYEHHRLEGLWVHQWHNVVNLDLLKAVLQSPEPRARAQAVRVLCYWRDRVPDALALLKTAAGDAHPRVRLEAVRTASFFRGADVTPAIDAANLVLKHPMDDYLNYAHRETMRQLNTLGKGTVFPTDPAAIAALVGKMSDAELTKAPPVEPVLMARLERKGTESGVRVKALTDLAAMHKTSLVAELIAALGRIDSAGGQTPDHLGKILASSDVKSLRQARAGIATLAGKAARAGVRRAAWSALVAADGDPQTTWADAKTDAARQSLIDAIGNLADPALRAKFLPMLNAVLSDAKTVGEVRAAALKALPLMGAENARVCFGTLAGHIQRGIECAVAARAIMQLPRDSWDKAQAGRIAEGILAWAKTVPAAERSGQEFVETSQAGMEFASLLAPADSARIRKELRGLGVSVFVVKTVREQMRYDITRLVVEAGKPFEVILENLDAMPHNVVFVEPGTRQSVAESVQANPPDKLDGQGRPYVPAGDKRVWGASKLVESEQKETIKLTAPEKEGEHEFVCTFPGHWMLMWGKLIVTKDVDGYLAANPNFTLPAPGTAPTHDHKH